jgi:hypothetical protein
VRIVFEDQREVFCLDAIGMDGFDKDLVEGNALDRELGPREARNFGPRGCLGPAVSRALQEGGRLVRLFLGGKFGAIVFDELAHFGPLRIEPVELG